jgi:hypothetical protein
VVDSLGVALAISDRESVTVMRFDYQKKKKQAKKHKFVRFLGVDLLFPAWFSI